MQFSASFSDYKSRYRRVVPFSLTALGIRSGNERLRLAVMSRTRGGVMSDFDPYLVLVFVGLYLLVK